MTNYAKHVSTKQTPQNEAIPGTAQVENSAGGFVFAIDDWQRLDRFCILGSAGGTYYASERKLTRENADCITRLLKSDEDGARLVERIVEISHDGRAPKNDPAIFALAMAHSFGGPKTKARAEWAMPQVCRIGTHLFQFAEAANSLRGWGRSLKRIIAEGFYQLPDVEKLAFQVSKYKQRNGWSHRDLLRLVHPNTGDPGRRGIFGWATHPDRLDLETGMIEATVRPAGGKIASDLVFVPAPNVIVAGTKLTHETNPASAAELIRAFDLPRELVNTDLLNNVDVWDALLERMPPTAMIRNLGKMTSIGLLKPLSESVDRVISVLGDEVALKRARLHPLTILTAMKTYSKGRGDKGSLTWTPVPAVIDALDGAFYKAFKTIEPTGKRILLGCDISGSMWGSPIAGSSLMAGEATAVLAMVTMATEQRYHIMGFTSARGGHYGGPHGGGEPGFTEVPISTKMRLDKVCETMRNMPMGGTDCALPMLYASRKKLEVDAFVVLTDNETWAGGIHPVQALKQYRKESGIPAKLIVIGMTATDFSIADPNDSGMLDLVGFDTAGPAIMADFIRS